MATHYIQKYPSVASFLAGSPDNSTAGGFGLVSDVLYQNVGGAAYAVAGKNAETVIATRTVLASENNKTFFLNAATEFVTTLPLPFNGARYRFVVTAAPSGADYTIVSNGAAEIILGSVHSAASAAGDTETTPGATTITFASGQAVAGDWVEVVSDGTNWYAHAFTAVDAGVTFTG
jgi:hypothetical protein